MTGSRPVPRFWPVLGLLYSATLWGMVWYPLRLLDDGGLNGIWQSLVSYGAALLVVLPFYWRRRGELNNRLPRLLLMALAIGWCNIAFVLAMLEGNVLRVLLFFYLSPIWTILLGRFFLHETFSAPVILGLLAGMLGMLLMLWRPELGFDWPRGRADWFALTSGMGFAVANVLTRYLQDISITGKTVVSWLGVLAVGLVALLASDPSLPAVAPSIWWGSILLGVLGFISMSFAVQYGVTHLPVQQSSVILLFELVAGGLSAWWLAGESLRVTEWAGGALIAAAGLIVQWRSADAEHH